MPLSLLNQRTKLGSMFLVPNCPWPRDVCMVICPEALTASFHQLFCLIWARSFQAICRPFVLLVICCYLEMVIKPAKDK